MDRSWISNGDFPVRVQRCYCLIVAYPTIMILHASWYSLSYTKFYETRSRKLLESSPKACFMAISWISFIKCIWQLVSDLIYLCHIWNFYSCAVPVDRTSDLSHELTASCWCSPLLIPDKQYCRLLRRGAGDRRREPGHPGLLCGPGVSHPRAYRLWRWVRLYRLENTSHAAQLSHAILFTLLTRQVWLFSTVRDFFEVVISFC